MYYSQKNKKFRDPRYFLLEDEEKPSDKAPTASNPAPSTGTSGSATEQPQGAKEVQIGIAGAFIEPGSADVVEQPYLSGSNMAAEPGAAGVIARARGPVGKNWTYSLTAYGGKEQGGLKDPKPDPDKIVPEQPGAFCDCTGYVSWAAGFWQKRSPFAMGMTSNLGQPASNPMPGDIAYRGPPPGGQHGHVGIVTAVNPENATTEDINNGKADVDIIHCSSRKPAGGAVVEDKNAIKNGWAGRGPNRAKVMFYRPTNLLNSPNASKCSSCPKKGSEDNKAIAGQERQPRQVAAQTTKLKEEKNVMRHNTWDRMMYRLLSEQAEKRRIAEKAFAGKKELDKDEDGVPKWADKDDSDPKVGSKGSKKTSKKKGKVPPQLKMHIKKKKSKLDESIARLERILIKEAVFDDFKKLDVNWLHAKGKEHYNNNIIAEITFDYPGRSNARGNPYVTMGSDNMYDPKQSAPNLSPIEKRAGEKIRSGEFKPRSDTPVKAEIQHWLDEVMAIKDKISPESEMFADGTTITLIYETENKETFLNFVYNLQDLSQRELDELGAYEMNVYSGKLKHHNGQNFVPFQGKTYRLKHGKIVQELEKDLSSDESVESSNPSTEAGNQITESIKKLKKLLREYEALEEYGEDRFPDMAEEDDDDFDADELPSYGREDFGDYGEESMKKFAQKSKTFADKYTEEDDDDEESGRSEYGSCPECGYLGFDGKECEDCGYESHDDDDDDEGHSAWDDGSSCPECGYLGFDGKECEDCGYEAHDEDEEEDLEESVEYLSEAEVKKKQPRLGKVTRNPSGSKKKFHVYVKCGGRVKKISFGDPGLSIKRDSAARRKNFRARHKCDKPAGKDRCTARYWSCYQWRAGKKVEGEE